MKQICLGSKTSKGHGRSSNVSRRKQPSKRGLSLGNMESSMSSEKKMKKGKIKRAKGNAAIFIYVLTFP